MRCALNKLLHKCSLQNLKYYTLQTNPIYLRAFISYKIQHSALVIEKSIVIVASSS